MMVQTGVADVVIAGGVESMSNVEYYTTDMRRGARAGSVTLHDRLARGRVMSQPIERFGVISGMIETAENLARDYDISREACDAYAAESHQRAAAAWADGKFDDELVPVSVPQKQGRPGRLRHGRGRARRRHGGDRSASCAPIEKDGVVTAGNASQQNDAAAACLVVAEDKLAELGLEPMGWFRELGGGRLRAVAHGHRPGAGGGAAVRAAPASAGTTSTWSSSTRPSRRRCWPC